MESDGNDRDGNAGDSGSTRNDAMGFGDAGGELPSGRPARKSPWVAIGCGGLVVVLILAAGALYFMWPRIVAKMVRTTVVEALDASTISDQEKSRVLASVDRLLDDFVAGKFDEKDFRRLNQNLSRSPLSRVLFVLMVKGHYLPQSGLTEEEKSKADRSIDRLLCGIMEGKVSDDDLSTLRKHFPRDEKGEPALDKPISDDTIRLLLADVDALVAAKGVPDEPCDLHVADELDRVIEATLGSGKDGSGKDGGGQDGGGESGGGESGAKDAGGGGDSGESGGGGAR